MAPRNSDGGSGCKKNFPVEDSDVSIKDIVPCLLHKKHKVVKLVKNQMQKINEEGLICSASGTDVEEIDMRRMKREISSDSDAEQGSEYEQREGSRVIGSGLDSPRARLALLMSALLFLLILLLLILLMVWISAGPLSRTIPHTPVPVGSFVRTENTCSLEKKYLLRWSKPEYFE